MKQTFEHPYYPIIYVRGYAASQSEIEETVADPYMGFNLGSTKLRQAWTGELKKFMFESPLVRLMKDFGYRDVYDGGDDMPKDVEISPRSILIYRYYNSASSDFGTGKRGEIEDYATGLGELVLELYGRFEDRLAGDRSRFKVYLAAHSMGGLICRCFLQNQKLSVSRGHLDIDSARSMIDKVFTYATPHNGIDVRVVGNVPGFLTKNNVDNFNRKRMREYLSIPNTNDADDVSSLIGKFDPSRFFCLVGTDHRDYAVAGQLASKVVGPMSDGLVRIKNATTWGPIQDTNGRTIKLHSPRALVHRSHSGHYGIVNSEEGYQNLIRFLFGDIRVEGKLAVDKITLPPDIQKKYDSGSRIRASYHFEVILRVRGKRWDLHRRIVNEESAIFRQFDELLRPTRSEKIRYPILFSTFLSANERVNKRRRSLGFSVDLGVLVPEYEVDGFLFLDKHYEGGYLYRDKLNLEALPPDSSHAKWRLRYGFDSRTPNRSTNAARSDLKAFVHSDRDEIVFMIPFAQKSRPGIEGFMELTATAWNERGRSPETDESSVTASPGGTLLDDDEFLASGGDYH